MSITRKGEEQLAKEAIWILSNYFKASTLEAKNKWLSKWHNWSDAQPEFAKQASQIIMDLYKKQNIKSEAVIIEPPDELCIGFSLLKVLKIDPLAAIEDIRTKAKKTILNGGDKQC